MDSDKAELIARIERLESIVLAMYFRHPADQRVREIEVEHCRRPDSIESDFAIPIEDRVEEIQQRN